MQITAIILAGGRGSRMGGADKGLVNYLGQRLIEHVICRIAPQVDAILINANRNLEIYQSLGYTVITDATTNYEGPLAGMQAGFKHTSTEWLIALPCDAPLLPLDLVARCMQATQHHHTDIATVRSQHNMHPVFCLMHRRIAASLDDFLASGQRKVSAWQALHQPAIVDFEDEQAFTNINVLP